MKKPLFTGVCTALVTPFRQDRPDLQTLSELIERQITAGVPALVISGTTGESATLSHEEKLTLFEHAAKTAAGRCVVIAGTGSNSTVESCALTAEAAQTGVDAALCVTPYYNKCTQDGLRRHYEAILEASRLPVILYNVPTRTGVSLAPETCAALCAHPLLAGLKEADPDVAKLFRLRRLCADALPVYCGNDDRIVPFYAAGASGVISVWSNVFPEIAVRLASLCEAGRFRAAAALQTQQQPLIEALFEEVNPIPVKAAMRMVGIDCGACRLPLTPPSPQLLTRLKALIKKTP